jgi:hypothetical protein
LESYLLIFLIIKNLSFRIFRKPILIEYITKVISYSIILIQNQMNKTILGFLILLGGCKSSQPVQLANHFDATPQTLPAPDYTNPNHWAALPTKHDMADSIPNRAEASVINRQASAKADVFFVHPTIFTEKPTGQVQWNADINDQQLNDRVDKTTILNQATVFNGSCRVFAPRYRQAHLFAFYTKDKADAKQALDFAYEDVKAAFEYYLKNHNSGRPIVIASHSQGTVHAVRLLQEFFDGKPLQKQLVEAYLIGRAVRESDFKHIRPSTTPTHTGGFVSWNTFARGYRPDYYEYFRGTVSTNPLTWSADTLYASQSLNRGGVGLKYTMYPAIADAQNHESLLWINKPYVTGRFLVKEKVWHKADINFFWMNIRENVALRLDEFLKAGN